MRRRDTLLGLLPALLLPGGCALPGPAGRDPAQQPFSVDSPWNTAIGTQARFVPIDSPAFDPARGARINSRLWSHPVFVASPEDPVVAIHRRGDADALRRLPVPPEARPDASSDGALHLITPDHREVIEMWQARRVGADRIEARVVVVNDLTGPGIAPFWHGARAYGGSAIGGLIRHGELAAGELPHALAAAVRPEALNRHGPDDRAWVWPASSADDGDGRRYGERGNLHMGSLLAIPPEVRLDTIDLQPGPETALARALQDRGVLITDCAAGNLVLYAEPAAADEVARIRPGTIAALVARLQIVANNHPASVGGGGRPRRPPVAPLRPWTRA